MTQGFTGRRRLTRDEGYSGPMRAAPYFEGWYLRQVTADRSQSLAVIVGVSLSPDPHAFIQMLSGPEARVLKIRFSLDEVEARRDRFDVRIAGSRFTPDFMELNIDAEGHRIAGRLSYTGRAEYPRTFWSPGIMGPFSWVPFMECIHGVISMDHAVEGRIVWNGDLLDFNGGRGYIEKDRGSSMPQQWIWAHTNQFENPGDTLMISVARIPWMGGSFVGHLGFLRFDGHLHRFGTYRGSRVRGQSGKDGLELSVSHSRSVLELMMEREGGGGRLDAPVVGAMSREIVESPASVIRASFREGGALLWEGCARPAAVEVAGEPEKLIGRL